MPTRILAVDDEPFNLDLLEQELGEHGYAIERATTGREALKKIEAVRPDLILLDHQLPDLSGLEVLKEIRTEDNEIPVILITAYGTVERAVEAMKHGAYDFVLKPFDPDYLLLTIRRALERERLTREVEILSEEVGDRYRLIVGKSRIMAAAVDMAKKAANSTATVLLLGESGTGKELFARAIHAWSERRRGPFVAINCVGLSKELLESELFGHERGAFTGAHQLKKGKMELAHGGSVFLDEVGDISQELQTKLLRFLQEREFERVGGTRPIRVDLRIIAATNRDLDAAVRDGRFRQDLYYRLNVVPIVLPPLRERREDISELAGFFLRRSSIDTKKQFTEIAEDALEKLVAYKWPGNVRELANVIERAVVLSEGPRVELHHLPPQIVAVEPGTAGGQTSYGKAVDAYRRELILKALGQTGGNRAAAARVLGLQRTYLARLIKSLRIE